MTTVGIVASEQVDDLLRIGRGIDRSDLHTRHVLAAILTIGNELVSGDTENTNASWLARRLESLGVRVAISASVPDELERIVEFVQRERERVDFLLVTGGLGGTPDDITREALAAAFGVPQEPVPALEADLRVPLQRRPRLRRPLGGAAARVAIRSTTRSAERPASGSRTPGCCRVSRAR